MRVEFSFDDGYKLDLKIARLLEKYGFRGTFYIPYTNRGYRGKGGLTNSEVVRLSKNHDIGFHTYSHPVDMKLIGDDDHLRHEITAGKNLLEGWIGRPIKSFCYPRGKYNTHVTDLVKEAGFIEARTVDVGKITLAGEDMWRKPTTVHIHPLRREYGDLKWWAFAAMKLVAAWDLKDLGYFHLWGHANELEEYDTWEEFENVLAMIKLLSEKK